MIEVACIVEGAGDEMALPGLLRRLASARTSPLQLRIHRPIRFPRTKLHKPGELERACEFAARQSRHRGCVIVLLDSDDECPKVMAPHLNERVRREISDVPFAVVLANREFEAWFLAAASSLAGQRALSSDLAPPASPEAIRDAKSWLTRKMSGSRSYKETADQPAFASLMDLNQARTAPSFDKLCREFERLIRLVEEGSG